MTVQLPSPDSLTIENAARIVGGWACQTDYVRRAWLYGSRIRRTNREDSDLDVAIEVCGKHAGGRCETPYTRFFFDHKEWAADLQQLLPWKVHLCHYNSEIEPDVPIEYGNVKKAVDEYGLLIFDRSIPNRAPDPLTP